MLPAYFADGFAHFLMGAVFFVALSQFRRFRKPASVPQVAGMLLTSSALFFLPAHLPWRGGALDAVWQFLHYPLSDWDILLLGMPYHRSLLTHSVVPAILVLPLAARPSGKAFVIGFSLGLASHLFWDAVSASPLTRLMLLPTWGFAAPYATLWLIAHTLLACSAAILPPSRSSR